MIQQWQDYIVKVRNNSHSLKKTTWLLVGNRKQPAMSCSKVSCSVDPSIHPDSSLHSLNDFVALYYHLSLFFALGRQESKFLQPIEAFAT